MGICFHDVRLMWDARRAGASFDRLLTIGRQSLCLHPAEAELFVAAHARAHAGAAKLPRGCLAFGVHAEPFLRACLGAGSVEALDYSPYDGAQHVHDMNEPVPESLVGRFDVVFDGGALEHIFNFPVAVSNLMRMAKVGGRVFMSTPANNFLGHGFYQFSPELMFRVFGPDNGFEIRTVQMLEARYPSPELTRNRTAYEVTDPAEVHCRVGLITKRPVIMLVEARKLEDKVLFARAPLQSDYVTVWSAAEASGALPTEKRAPARRSWRGRLLALAPATVRTVLTGWVQRRRFSFANRRFYRRIS
jgi:SAM-dependent methyltransferase